MFFDKESVGKIMIELDRLLESYKRLASDGGQFDGDAISDDMVYRERRFNDSKK